MGQLFKELQEADAEAVFALLREVYTQPSEPLGGAWNLRTVEKELAAGRGLGVWQAGQWLAVVLYRPSPVAWEISILATHPQRRRQGLMRALMGELLRRRPMGVELWLEVHAGNASALALYQACGATEVGRRPGYYRDGATAILLAWR